MDINEIIDLNGNSAEEIIAALKQKSIDVPQWGGKRGLKAEYDPTMHPVMDRGRYPDLVNSDGTPDYVTRITYDLQRLAVKRMTELCNGIPVKRIYTPQNERQKVIATALESIFQRNRINSVNIERNNMLFAGCEVMTLWYAVEQPTQYGDVKSNIKLRCANYSPILGDELYPLFDEQGDLIALSVSYRRKVGKRTIDFFDAYTADRHIKWSTNDGSYGVIEDEQHTVGKIPGIYMWRPMPIWENSSNIVYELEWAMSRNGNYLRKNSKPLFVVMADEQIAYGDEKTETREARAVLQYPKGSTAQYVTWAQAVENLKFYCDSLRQSFFTQLQLPDWNYEKMSQMALSGESRKQLFIDAQMKVKDESGRLEEFYSREVNVVKQFLIIIMGESYAADIHALPVEIEITPFSISDEKDTISNLYLANGGKPLMSHRESVEQLGWSQDVDETMRQIEEDQMRDAFEPTM